MSSIAKGFSVSEFIGRVLPADVMRVEQYFGSFVRLNCVTAGQDPFEVRVYLADWVFFIRDEAIADSCGIAALNNGRLAVLKGTKLQELVTKGRRELWLIFSDEMSLKLTANLNEYEPEDELLIASLHEEYLKFSPTQGLVIAVADRTEH